MLRNINTMHFKIIIDFDIFLTTIQKYKNWKYEIQILLSLLTTGHHCVINKLWIIVIFNDKDVSNLIIQF